MVGEDYTYETDEYSYSISFEFQADVDLMTCENFVDKITPDNSSKDCYDQKWKWENASQKTLVIVEDDEEATKITIISLTSDKLEGTASDPDGTDEYDIIFEKIN